jgi:hypothetical protein
MKAAGLGALLRTTWGGASAEQASYYLPPWASFELERGAHDAVPENPGLTYHAVVVVDGIYYDPSYGRCDAVPPSATRVCAPYSVSESEVDEEGFFHVLCCCSPPTPEYVPTQQWGGTWPPGALPLSIVKVHCFGVPPPP